MQGLKYGAFPVVSALAGKALGGGCELLLHSDAIQAHANSFPGLVEPAVGLVPAWGGCTQMLLRQSFPVARNVPKVFQNIARCRVANELDEAREMIILRAGDGITMNRSRLLADAKERCLQMAKDYSPPERRTVHLPGAVLKRIIDGKVGELRARAKSQGTTRLYRERFPMSSAVEIRISYARWASRSCSISSAQRSWNWSKLKRRSSASTIWWNMASRSGSLCRRGLHCPAPEKARPGALRYDVVGGSTFSPSSLASPLLAARTV